MRRKISFTIRLINIKIKINIFYIDKKMKLKTRKAAAKRIKAKKNCLCRKKAYKSHLLRRKNSKRLRRLAAPAQVHPADFGKFLIMLPYM